MRGEHPSESRHRPRPRIDFQRRAPCALRLWPSCGRSL